MSSTEERASSSDEFEGDRGIAPLDTRRALVQLLQGPSIDARRHGILWRALLRDEDLVRSRLSEVFLELVLDREAQVAFCRQAELEGIEVPRLLRRVQLTFVDSVLLLYLRQSLIEASSRGERATVEARDIREHLSLYERSANTDHAGFERRCSSSIEKMKDKSILLKIAGVDGRFEVSPALSLLFPAEEVIELTRLYERMAEDGAIMPDEDDPDKDQAETIDGVEGEDR